MERGGRVGAVGGDGRGGAVIAAAAVGWHLTCIVLGAAAATEPLVLRPLYGAGDALWGWPRASRQALERPGERITWGRVSAWQPFGVEGLSALTWDMGDVGGLWSRWGGWVSGAYASTPHAQHVWIDGSLLHRRPRGTFWVGGGAGATEWDGRFRRDGWSGVGGFLIPGRVATVTASAALNGGGGSGGWSWQWSAAAVVTSGPRVSWIVESVQDAAGRASFLVGARWCWSGSPTRLAAAANVALGTSLFVARIDPGLGFTVEVWAHAHPDLGWTPGISLAW